jgi:beta-glucosidase
MKKRIWLLLSLSFACGLVNAQAQGLPYQDAKLPVDQRVDDLISRMTIEEKVLQLFNEAPAIERLGVPAYNWWNECLHGVARAGKATVFPQAIGMAATFDQDLMYKVGTAISDEARAKHHNFVRNNARAIYMGLTFWTPNINIFRDPRWGRGQETYGEDPYLTSRMGVNFIKGLQGDDPNHLKVVATAKHYAVHSGPEKGRHSDNFYVNDRDLYETYLPAFEAAVKEANVQSVMCAYNRFRDKPCCGSDLLLNNILRNNFGFKGYVVSDCGAISDFYYKNNHHIVETPSQAWGWSLSSGTDLNCEENKAFIEDNLQAAIEKGIVNEADINVSLKRLFKARFLLGMFDDETKVPYAKIPMSVVGSKEHLQLTQEVAEKSLVLLKNDGLLPLKSVNKVALIGPNANNPAILIGNYNGDPINPITPLKAMQDRFGDKNVLYTPGCPLAPGVYTDYMVISDKNLYNIVNGKLSKGLKAEYFEDPNMKGAPKLTRIDRTINFYWEKSPINQVVDEPFSVRWTGILLPEKSGTFLFGGNVKLKLDGNLVSGQEVTLKKGTHYKLEATLKVEAFWWSSNHQQQFANLTWVETSRNYQQEAIDAVTNADVVVFCGGISSDLEGEEMNVHVEGFDGGDRTNLNLPKIQEDLLKELHKMGKPIIFVNMSGSAIALNWENDNLPAIVQAFYPGEATGTALTRLLMGDYSPSGRLPITFYRSADDLPSFKEYEMKGRTYRYFEGKPLYEFGYGLSYTTFAYSNMKAPMVMNTSDVATVSVAVTNTGSVAGEEVVQLYVANDLKDQVKPIRSLIGFQRVFLNPGETKNVAFSVKTEQLSVIDKMLERKVYPGNYQFSVGGKQPDEQALKNKTVAEKSMELTGNPFKVN